MTSHLNLFPLAGPSVEGLEVDPEVPNTASIASSLDDYEVLSGIRLVPMSDLEATSPHELFYASDDIQHVKWLAQDISRNGYIKPLIVVIDSKGPYILEGAHRLGALHLLKVKKFPALVVLDHSEET